MKTTQKDSFTVIKENSEVVGMIYGKKIYTVKEASEQEIAELITSWEPTVNSTQKNFSLDGTPIKINTCN